MISSSSGSILIPDSVLKTLLVVDYTIYIWTQNLLNFIAKFGSKAEICWKLKDLKWIFLNNSEVSRNLLGHILLFWKVTMPAFQKTSNFQWILPLKKILVEGRCVRDVPRGFGPCTFLVPSILLKLVFLDSAKTKLSESGVLSWIRSNF
jgi:hypothetical protein